METPLAGTVKCSVRTGKLRRKSTAGTNRMRRDAAMSEEKIMGFEEILGNEMVKDHFKKAIQNHKISHAYILTGEKPAWEENRSRECVYDDAPVRERRK